MKRSLIELNNVSKKFVIPHEKVNTLKGTMLNFWNNRDYEAFYALKDVSISVREGEFLGVVGGNGSGKSTLLKIIAGIYAPDAGNVHVRAGVSPFLELGVGFNGELTGRENVYLYGAVLGLKKKQIDSKFDEIVSFAGLEKFMDLKMKNYSSGMFARLAFSVAIRADAPILLIDEVLAVGDADFQKKCFKVFDGLKMEGKTVVLVSHDTEAICSYCDRAVMLEGGCVRECGDPREVIKKYSFESSGSCAERAPLTSSDGPSPNGMISIDRVHFLDTGDNERDSFGSSEAINVIVAYSAVSEIASPVFGILIRDENGTTVYGTNTRTRGPEIGALTGKGVVSVKLKRPPVLQGKLVFSFAFVSRDFKETYAWSDCPYTVDIKNDSGDLGKVSCDVEFSF